MMGDWSPANNTVALFYDGFEAQANDRPFGKALSDLRGSARSVYRTLRRKQLYTGYYTAFLNLKHSLEANGLTVRVNDFAYARAHPYEPIGISGYPTVFEKVRLENPAVFGPGFVPRPPEITEIMNKCNIRVVTLPSDWPCRIWRPVLDTAVQPMFVSIDDKAWPDLSRHEKSTDILIYDKVRWHGKDRDEDLVQPLLSHLRSCGISYTILRYGEHHLTEFRQGLSLCRAMVFLCEHETQGLAYQEALSSNIPVLAWDEGVLVDPHQREFAPEDLIVSSVPYFDERCGMTFDRSNAISMFDSFWGKVEDFSPRSYVLENLNLEAGATRYLSLLKKAVNTPAATPE